MEFIAILSEGKGTWGQIAGLMKKGEWEKIILVGPSYAQDFKLEEIPFDFVEYDNNKTLVPLRDELIKKLKDKFSGTEVAVSIASGSGKEHMALVSALLSIPVGVRFTALTKDGIVMM